MRKVTKLKTAAQQGWYSDCRTVHAHALVAASLHAGILLRKGHVGALTVTNEFHDVQHAVQRTRVAHLLSAGPGKATMKSCMLHSSGMCTAKSLIILDSAEWHSGGRGQ